jgi:hypothetical protein
VRDIRGKIGEEGNADLQILQECSEKSRATSRMQVTKCRKSKECKR